jgi:NAD(P)-dependent dehydrogenase (short-subunit alcohol dehydrogenase family)
MGRVTAHFEGDVAVVTGAASGIGHEIVRMLCQAGAKVHGFDIAPVETASFELEPHRTAPVMHTVDVRDTTSVEDAVGEVVREEGTIDLLVNCAGITRDRALWNLTDDDWESVVDVNLTGAWRVLRAVARPMRERCYGRIVQIASINGLRGRFGQSNYSASKAGLIGLTRTAARELGPKGITVNAIAPGMIETRMSRDLPPEVLKHSVEETALGRLGRPEDVASAVLFLLSDQAAHISGAILSVDGGQLA